MISDVSILVAVVVALILLIWLITTNPILLNGVKHRDSSGFADGLRSLDFTDSIIYAVSLTAAIAGPCLYAWRRYKGYGSTFSQLSTDVTSDIRSTFSGQSPPAASSSPISTNVKNQTLGQPGEDS